MVAHTHHVCDTRDCQRCTVDRVPLPDGDCYACDDEADAWAAEAPVPEWAVAGNLSPARPRWQATGDNVDWLAVWETVFEEELEASDEPAPAPTSRDRRRPEVQDLIRVRQRRPYRRVTRYPDGAIGSHCVMADHIWNVTAPGCMTLGPHNPVVKNPPPPPPGDMGDQPWNTFQRRYKGTRADPEARRRFEADQRAGKREGGRLQRLGLMPRMLVGSLDPSGHDPEGIGIFAALTRGPDVADEGPDGASMKNYTKDPSTDPRAGRWVDWDAPYLAHLERWQRWHHRRTVWVRRVRT